MAGDQRGRSLRYGNGGGGEHAAVSLAAGSVFNAGFEPPRAVCARRGRDHCGGRSFSLGACQYPGIVTPRGFELLEAFRPEPCATWIYSLGGTRLEKQVYLVEGKPAVVIRYRADRAFTLRVRPFLADRDYHSLQSAVQLGGNWSSARLQFHGATLIEDAHWYYNIE